MSRSVHQKSGPKNIKRCMQTILMDFFHSPGADSENLDFVASVEEHRFYGIFCFFGSSAFI